MLAAAVAALALGLAGGALLWIMVTTLDDGAFAELDDQVGNVTELVAESGVRELATARPHSEGIQLQVVDETGRVQYESPRGSDVPITLAHPAPGVQVRSGGVLDGTGMVVARGVSAEGHRFVVVAANPLTRERQLVQAVTVTLVVGVPLLTVTAAAAVWLGAGRILRPVAQIAARAEEITATDLHLRVPVPAEVAEFAALATTVNGMLARLEQGREREQRFVADAAHELRSPLSSLRAGLDLARAHPETWTEIEPVLQAETDRLRNLVDDLVLLARLDNHGAVSSDEIDLDDLVEAEAQRLRLHADRSVTVHTAPIQIRGDRNLVVHALRNLGDNAVRHAGGTVALALAADPDDPGVAVVSVDDDGPGIPAEERERVVQRFVRLDASRGRESGGAGLGLAIVATVAAGHGGEFRIGASPLGGARCELRLPLDDSAAASADQEGPDSR